MRATTTAWLAAIITAHSDELAADLGSFARQQTPLYACGDYEALYQRMERYFTALAQTIAAGDTVPLRAFLEHNLPPGLQDGAEGAGYIRLVDQAEELVAALIAASATDAEQAAEARRLAAGSARNARLIVSEVNLKLLIDPAHYDDPQAPARFPRLPPKPAA